MVLGNIFNAAAKATTDAIVNEATDFISDSISDAANSFKNKISEVTADNPLSSDYLILKDKEGNGKFAFNKKGELLKTDIPYSLAGILPSTSVSGDKLALNQANAIKMTGEEEDSLLSYVKDAIDDYNCGLERVCPDNYTCIGGKCYKIEKNLINKK